MTQTWGKTTLFAEIFVSVYFYIQFLLKNTFYSTEFGFMVDMYHGHEVIGITHKLEIFGFCKFPGSDVYALVSQYKIWSNNVTMF